MSGADRLKKQLVAALSAHMSTGARPNVPEAGWIYWRWFCDVSATRTYHMAGPNPISHGEIEAWSRLHRWPIEARHIEILMALDRAWLGHWRISDRADSATAPRSSGQPITPAAFDVVFG